MMHGYNMGLPEDARPAVSSGGFQRQGLTSDAWLDSLHRHYSRPELQGLRGDLRIAASSGPGETLAKNVSPLEAFEKALEWARKKGFCK